MEEYIDEVDASGRIISSHPKSLLKNKMFMHKVSLVIPRTADGKFILSKRSKNKFPFPDTWCCAVGGKVSSGESEEEAAVREMGEEIGINASIMPVSSTVYDKGDYKGLFSVFTSQLPVNVEDMVLDEDEIQELGCFSLEEIGEMINEDKEQFAPTFRAVLKDFIDSSKK